MREGARAARVGANMLDVADGLVMGWSAVVAAAAAAAELSDV
jgi:hypothetical protein